MNTTETKNSRLETKETKSNSNLSVLDSMPIVELSSQTVFPNRDANAFTWKEQQLFHQAKQIVLMIDVEACDAARGPVLAIGCVLAVYRDYMTYDIIHRKQWILQRDLSDCDPNTKRFWDQGGKGNVAWNYFTQQCSAHLRLSETAAASSFREYLNMVWKWIPQLCIMVDSVHVDLTLLNNLLLKYHLKPIHYDESGIYKHAIYVSRDLMRGAFAMIDGSFSKYQQTTGLEKAIREYWKKNVGAPNNLKKPFWGGANHDIALYGKTEKHFCVWDAFQSVTLLFQMEDIRSYLAFKATQPTPYQQYMFIPIVNTNPLYLPVASSSSASSLPSHFR